MLAAVRTEYGAPDVVRVMTVEDVTAGPNDVLIKIRFSTVNRTDCAYRSGSPRLARLAYGFPKPRALILGMEFAGVVAEVGSAVTAFAVGDRVFGYNEGPCGGHAEYIAVPETGPIARVPDGVDISLAAASTEGAHYAMTMIDKAKVQAGQRVLVNGGTGGIGSAAVQLLRDLGADVTAVAPTDHVELVRGLGASRVIDFQAEDFTQDQQRYDLVVDAVGKSTFGQCRPLLTNHGVYVSSELGPWAQNPALALLAPISRGKRVIFPIPTHNQEVVEHIAGLLASGALKPVIDREYALADVVEAYRYVESGQKVGNVLLKVADDSSGPH